MTALKVAGWALLAVLVLALIGLFTLLSLLRGVPDHVGRYEP